MRLSEAIRLGSLAIQPCKNWALYPSGQGCAIGMSLVATGIKKLGDGCGNAEGGYLVRDAWPWIVKCPLDVVTEIMGRFDSKVMCGGITIEQLCDTVAIWERDCESKGVNVEQVTMAAELNQPASQAAEHTEKELAVEAK